MPDNSVAIIGAGPAGLTAAYLLSKHGVPVTTLEQDPHFVGGISRTVHYKGYCFDIGGHRFFSKSKAVEDLWDEILPHDFLARPRKSRIYYRKRYFSYPLEAGDALRKLGPVECTRCVLSYLAARLFPKPAPRNFTDWVSNAFGRRLFEIFFKTYTEKVWGLSCSEISADWAAQRIKGLSLGRALFNAVWKRKHGPTIKTLIDSFRYPRKGPGMMWEACAAKVLERGGAIRAGQRVNGCTWNDATRHWTVTHCDADGRQYAMQARHVISSAPLRQLAHGLRPALSAPALQAAASLRYRDFITVALILPDRGTFSDNWIYIHDASVKVGRIQNFKSWSADMVPDPAMCCYGLEYFCFEGDGLWNSSDADLVELAKRELETIGLARCQDIHDGCVVRQPKAYPVYDEDYANNVATVRDELEARFPTLHLVGRNGMHKYNNQDHSMMTAMLCVENILAQRKVYDLWRVNQDAEYQEESSAKNEASAGRLVPERLPRALRRAA